MLAQGQRHKRAAVTDCELDLLWAPWWAHEPARCVAALLGAPNELSRILGLVSRTCASGRGCRAAGVASNRAVRASGCEAPHVQRNISSACTSSLATGSPSYVSVDVARSQVNGGVPFALNPMDANELTR